MDAFSTADTHFLMGTRGTTLSRPLNPCGTEEGSVHFGPDIADEIGPAEILTPERSGYGRICCQWS